MFGSYENNFHKLLEYEIFCAFHFLDDVFGKTKYMCFLSLNITWKVLLGYQFECGTADLLKTFVKKCSLFCSSIVSEL